MNLSAPLRAEWESPAAESSEGTRRWRPFSWLTVLMIGLALYELTAQPALGAVAVCIKFGWEDFLTAIWLRRRDPNGGRGRACFWLYLAGGLWNTAVAAGAMLFAFAVVLPNRPNAPVGQADPLLESIFWVGMTTLVGLTCAALAFAYAGLLARWGGFKLWLSRSVHLARRRDAWPPVGVGGRPFNRAAFMAVATLFVLGIPLILLASLVAAFVVVAVVNAVWALVVLMPLVVVGCAALLLYCVDLLNRLLLAELPEQCWGPAYAHEGMASASANALH